MIPPTSSWIVLIIVMSMSIFMSSDINLIIEIFMIHLLSSHIAFIIEMSVCWYDSPYELSYCLYHWNVCLLIWFTLWALILSLSLKYLSVDMIHPMSSHIVFIIDMSVWCYDSPYELIFYELSYHPYHWNISGWALILSLSLKCLWVTLWALISSLSLKCLTLWALISSFSLKWLWVTLWALI